MRWCRLYHSTCSGIPQSTCVVPVGKVVKKRRPLRNFRLTVRWIAAGLPDSRSIVITGTNIGDAIDSLDDREDDPMDLPDDVDKDAVTALHFDIKEIPS